MWQSEGRMTPAKAQHELDCMAAIVEVLKRQQMISEADDDLQRTLLS